MPAYHHNLLADVCLSSTNLQHRCLTQPDNVPQWHSLCYQPVLLLPINLVAASLLIHAPPRDDKYTSRLCPHRLVFTSEQAAAYIT